MINDENSELLMTENNQTNGRNEKASPADTKSGCADVWKCRKTHKITGAV